ncbi:FAD binding domain-containing protein [Candidatus Oscillochloris fontis]|uniref:FAD binding domain-containing protein n=1 Tax=Candidatus Oscillochloris fontis TaxID=2496868 RepID=UPI00101B6A03|nr:xanthine dehydrogenase family protein subunit M [Candidatus Oscillochloris fontis]
MIPSPFEYLAPTSVDEAITLLQEYGEDAKILAGGHSLIPAMKLRLSAPSILIDITRIAELRGIVVNGTINIGAGTTWQMIEHHPELKQVCPVLPQAVAKIGDIQVRNRGTLGGSLAHADPAADITAVVLVLDAQIRTQGPNGSRTISAADFFVDMLTTALEPEELITAIICPRLGADEGAAYTKFPHPASRYPIVGAAAYLKLTDGKVSACRVAITGAGPMPTRQIACEQALLGTDASDAAIANAAALAGQEMEILGDIHASEEYRRAMVQVYTKRALLKARGAIKL